jgi:hypothetical protein
MHFTILHHSVFGYLWNNRIISIKNGEDKYTEFPLSAVIPL